MFKYHGSFEIRGVDKVFKWLSICVLCVCEI